jgi:hypothetical protein
MSTIYVFVAGVAAGVAGRAALVALFNKAKAWLAAREAAAKAAIAKAAAPTPPPKA